ncbi:MAG TPA: sialidase family protein [Gaiellaceae bacterium]|nr:sialidase family protein [Gaiellaceae bacterium]
MRARTGFRVLLLAALVAAVVVPLTASSANTSSTLKEVSQDQIADGMSEGASEVQPSIASALGSQTIVSAFEVGRVAEAASVNGGSSAIGFTTSTNGGKSWGQRGLLPITVAAGGPSSGSIFPAYRAADPSVAFDVRFGQWLVASRALGSPGNVLGIVVNRSTDGTSWSAPIVAHQAGTGDIPDKTWITCDNASRSKGYGNCYLAYTNTGSTPANQLEMLTSTDGGQTWSAPAAPADASVGTAAVPLVQPPAPGAAAGSTCGRVVVPYASGTTVDAFFSSDCGATWSAHSVVSATATTHTVAQGLRTSLVPSDTMDGGGSIYLTWQTRSFRTAQTTLSAAANAGDTNIKVASVTGMVAGNTLTIDTGAAAETVTISTVGTAGATGTGVTFAPALAAAHAAGTFVTVNGVTSTSTAAPNDIALSVMPGATDATPAPAFGTPARIPIEADSGALSDTVDHFIPSIAADPSTSGATAHLALFYYFYPVSSCNYIEDVQPNPLQCQPDFGYVSSVNAGSTWTAPTTVATMASLAVLVRDGTGNGSPDLGLYTSSVIAPPGKDAGRAFSVFALGTTVNGLDESMYIPIDGLGVGGGAS